ncbi:MAG: hypothetical protein ACOYBY_09765 [Dermatophilaceae bacterium]
MNRLRRPRSPKLAAIVGLVLVLALLVAWDAASRPDEGSAAASHAATPTAVPTTVGAETPEQAAAIAAKAIADSNAAVQQGGPEGQAARDALFTGRALIAANAENQLLGTQTPEQKEANALTDNAPAVVAVSQGSDYPRSMLVQTTRRQSGYPVLTLLVAPDAQRGYQVAASATLLTSAYVAGFDPVRYGSPWLADASHGLGSGGEAVFAEYARVLAYPAPQTGDLPFAPDTFATSVRDAAAGVASSLGSAVTYGQAHTYQGLAGGFGLADNGGSLVFVVLDRVDTIKENSANAVNAPPVFSALSGKTSIDTQGEQKSLEFLLFSVPPDGKATLVGARVQPYAATAQ